MKLLVSFSMSVYSVGGGPTSCKTRANACKAHEICVGKKWRGTRVFSMDIRPCKALEGYMQIKRVTGTHNRRCRRHLRVIRKLCPKTSTRSRRGAMSKHSDEIKQRQRSIALHPHERSKDANENCVQTIGGVRCDVENEQLGGGGCFILVSSLRDKYRVLHAMDTSSSRSIN